MRCGQLRRWRLCAARVVLRAHREPQVALCLCLVYTAFVTPFEVAFLWKEYEWGVSSPLAPYSGCVPAVPRVR